MEDIEKLKYPIGKLVIPNDISASLRHEHIKAIENLPKALYEITDVFNDEQLDTPYRPGGWTVRQLIHHIADSHINAFTRFKLGMTEDEPTIRPYDQESWCNMSDATNLDHHLSLNIISGIHGRWVRVLNDMTDDDYNKNVFHPEMDRRLSLGQLLCQYGWHSNHHLAHITGIRERKNW
jgi:hypothetical protein